jgi:hypothetical protein
MAGVLKLPAATDEPESETESKSESTSKSESEVESEPEPEPELGIDCVPKPQRDSVELESQSLHNGNLGSTTNDDPHTSLILPYFAPRLIFSTF